jgi:hypothetical protein
MLSGVHRQDLSFQGLAPGVYLMALESDEGMGYKARSIFKVAVLAGH